ncbi:MAG: hypothetical protein KKA56_19320, partial [Gammaproteobacteria bacterium]|nr:hypothetical protein [Gammaproteobacteria bacterium]
KERIGTDIDRERLQQHRSNENPRHEQRQIERDSKRGELADRPATERQMTVDSGTHRGKSREMKERIDLPTPTGTDQLRQERPVYNTPRQIERAERRDSNIARSVEQQRPVYETTKPIDRQYPRERQERQERPVYAVPKPIERQERQERPVYETPRPIERQQPSYQAPRQMERASRPQESSRPERQRTVERRGSIE